MSAAEQDNVHELPVGRHFALDERGVALRATWRLDRGFVNLSLWRDDRCSETFHLRPDEAARLVSFLVTGLADAAAAASAPRLAVVPPRPTPRERLADALEQLVGRLRR